MSNGGTTPLIVEIDGYKGHSSNYKIRRDKRRTKDIQALWGDNIVFQRYTPQEIEACSDEEIKKEIGIV